MRKRCYRQYAAIGIAAMSLSGCTTFSFAPPPVQTDYRIGPSRSVCSLSPPIGDQILKNFRGARDLIDNFTVAYRCASHEAADGRQIFEVPSFLALVTAALGPTFGLTDKGRIAAAGVASVYGRANSYYAPREKIPALDAALDAVLCIKSESAGVAFFDTRQGDAERVREAVIKAQAQVSKVQTILVSLEARRLATVAELNKLSKIADASSAARTALLAELKNLDASISGTKAELTTLEAALNVLVDPKTVAAATMGLRVDGITDPELAISVHEQYFEMVSSSLLSVERVLASRLKSVGKYDPAGLQAEMAKLIAEKKDADDNIKSATFTTLSDAQKVTLKVEAIQPKLQTCVVRAKLG